MLRWSVKGRLFCCAGNNGCKILKLIVINLNFVSWWLCNKWCRCPHLRLWQFRLWCYLRGCCCGSRLIHFDCSINGFIKAASFLVGHRVERQFTFGQFFKLAQDGFGRTCRLFFAAAASHLPGGLFGFIFLDRLGPAFFRHQL